MHRSFKCVGCKSCVLARTALGLLSNRSMCYWLPTHFSLDQCNLLWASFETRFGSVVARERGRIKKLLARASVLRPRSMLLAVAWP